MSTFRTLGIEEISHRISGADALIVCHTSPDGDTVGSAFALAEIIRLTGGDARVVCSETFPDRFSFMTRGESGEYRDGEENGKTLICVDVASPAQLGRLTHLAAKADIMIDHHGTGEIFSDGLVDPDAAAAGIIVYDIYKFMRESGAVPESAYTARMLYAAVSSDTGSFRYANTDARAHLCAAYLVGIINSDKDGEDTAQIARLLFDSKTVSELRAQALASKNLRLLCGTSVALTVITQSDLESAGLTWEDCSAVVDIPRSVRGALIGVAAKEKTPGEYRISCRSNCAADVAAVCASFGGGGHTRAAGATVRASSPDELIARITPPLEAAVKENRNAERA